MSFTRKPPVGKTGDGPKPWVKVASPVGIKLLDCASGVLRQAMWYPNFAALVSPALPLDLPL
ncbi:hypothetical protein AAG593_08760 [Citromicrobium bathyomarinum]